MITYIPPTLSPLKPALVLKPLISSVPSLFWSSPTLPLLTSDRDGGLVEAAPHWCWEAARSTVILWPHYSEYPNGILIPSLEDVGGVICGSVWNCADFAFIRTSLMGPPTLPAWLLVFSIPSGLLLCMIWSGSVTNNAITQTPHTNLTPPIDQLNNTFFLTLFLPHQDFHEHHEKPEDHIHYSDIQQTPTTNLHSGTRCIEQFFAGENCGGRG